MTTKEATFLAAGYTETFVSNPDVAAYFRAGRRTAPAFVQAFEKGGIRVRRGKGAWVVQDSQGAVLATAKAWRGAFRAAEAALSVATD